MSEGLVTLVTVLDESGEEAPEDVKELILRGRSFKGFDPSCGGRLASLEILSLSNNAFTSLEGFHMLHSLMELNLNFNKVSDLAPLRCPNLRKLYLSNNAVVNIDVLQDLDKLHTLCLFRNMVFDLERCVHTLQRLPKLRVLDLDGNPCVSKPGARHHLVRSLPLLKRLDGEAVTSLDHELADMDLSKGDAGPARPSTAPVGRRGGAPGEAQSVALEYMAQDAMAGAFQSSAQEFQAWKRDTLRRQQSNNSLTKPPLPAPHAPLAPPRRKGSRSGSLFVDRLRSHRSASPSPPPSVVTAEDPAFDRQPLPRAGSASSGMSAASTPRPDSADANATIRQLLITIEVLKRERDEAASGGDAVPSDLLEEVTMLRIENQNMLVLREENLHLRKQVKALRTEAEESPLRAELRRLQHEVEELRQRNRVLQSQAALAEVQRPRTAQDALKECEDFDSELATLIQRNQATLRQLHSDLEAVKHPEDGPTEAPAPAAAGTGPDVWIAPEEPAVVPPPLPPRPSTASGDRILDASKLNRAFSGARPTTPNLLGRPLLTTADVEAAYEAVAAAQMRKAALEEERTAVDARLAAIEAVKEAAGEEGSGSGESASGSEEESD